MKKSLLLAGMLAMGIANAQTGKVGINTENPNETLEINGTLRVDNLPESGVGAIYDGAETAETTFTGTKLMVADGKGNVGTANGFPIMHIGGEYPIVDAFDPITDEMPKLDQAVPGLREHKIYLSKNGVDTWTFTLEKESYVHISANTSFQLAELRNAPDTISRRTKRLGLNTTLNGQYIATAGINLVFQDDVTEPNDLSDSDGTAYNTGYVVGRYSISNAKWLRLPKGTYSLKFEIQYSQHGSDLSHARFTFASSGVDSLEVISYPLEF